MFIKGKDKSGRIGRLTWCFLKNGRDEGVKNGGARGVLVAKKKGLVLFGDFLL